MTTTRARGLHQSSEISERTDVRAGSPLPLGTQERGGGVNFALFSRHASRVRLELFEHPEDAQPVRVIDLDSARHRTGDVWHVWVQGIGRGQLYAYRVDGPYEPSKGHRYNFNRLLTRSVRERDLTAARVGVRVGTWLRTFDAGTRPRALEAGQRGFHAEMRIRQRALRFSDSLESPLSS
jgi:1,4-alpha-glucan branching enzyme